MADIDLTTPLSKVLGGNGAKLLAEHLDLHTVGDLVYHFPRRYEERGEHTDIRALEIDTDVTVFGQVKRVNSRQFTQQRGATRGKRGSLVQFRDELLCICALLGHAIVELEVGKITEAE